MSAQNLVYYLTLMFRSIHESIGPLMVLANREAPHNKVIVTQLERHVTCSLNLKVYKQLYV